MKLVDEMRRLLQLEGPPLVIELYRQILNRPPDPAGFTEHLGSLAQSSKTDLLRTFLDSEECKYLLVSPSYSPSYADYGESRPRVIEMLRQMLGLEGEVFITRLYWGILERLPDEAGYAAHLGDLRSGKPKLDVLYFFLKSPEAMIKFTERFQENSRQPDSEGVLDRLLTPWWKLG